MSLFCGTYFPLSELPSALIAVAYALPLTHVLLAVRTLLGDGFHPDLILNLSYLLLFAIVFTNIAAAKMKKKLII
jgi:lipooligosaccharide transport system permease protein